MKIIISFFCFWILSGIAAAGFINAEFRCSYKNNYKDASWAATNQGGFLIVSLIGGPIALLVYFPSSGFGFNGWTLNRSPIIGDNCL